MLTEQQRIAHRIANKKWKKNHPIENRRHKNKNYDRGNINLSQAGSLWTLSDMKKIIDPNRPCDRILSFTLGRSVRAIQDKRHAMKKQKTD